MHWSFCHYGLDHIAQCQYTLLLLLLLLLILMSFIWCKFEGCSKCAMSTVTGIVVYVIKNVFSHVQNTDNDTEFLNI